MLPASQLSVKKQILQLALVQQLETVQDRVFVRFGIGVNPSARSTNHLLTNVIEAMRQDTTRLRFLAEEYGTNPEGVLLCLQEVSRNMPDLRSRIKQVKALSEHRSAKVAKKVFASA